LSRPPVNLAQARRVRGRCRQERSRLARRTAAQPACARGCPLAGLRRDDALRGAQRCYSLALRCPRIPARVALRASQPCAGPPGNEPLSQSAISACPASCGAASLRKGTPPRSFTHLSYDTELRPRKKSRSKLHTVLAQMTLSRESRGHCTAASISKKTINTSPNMG